MDNRVIRLFRKWPVGLFGLSVFFLATFFCSSLIGQIVVEPSVISTAGGRIETASMTLDWTLGETFVSDSKVDDRRFTEGFHQPVLTVEMAEIPATTAAEKLESSKKFKSSNAQNGSTAPESVPRLRDNPQSAIISIWPNPVCENLTIRISSDELANFQLQLFDAQGHLLDRSDHQPTNSAFEMPMNDRPNGLYFLQFLAPDGQPLGSRKITLAR